MRALACGAIVAWLMPAIPAAAQTTEFVPFVGYRGGGDFFGLLGDAPKEELEGTAFGLICDIALDDELAVEVLFTRQSGRALVPGPGPRPVSVEATSAYWQVGGLRALTRGRFATPFLTGTLGVTHLSVGGDDELRFSLSAGGGVKLRATRHLAVRLDARLLATFVDGSITTVVCTTGRCLTGIHLSTVWQGDVSAGLAVAF